MKQLTKDELVRNTYNIKLVVIFTILAIAGILVYEYFDFFFGLVVMIIALANITKTIETPFRIDRGEFFIIEQEILSLQDNILHFEIDSIVVPKITNFKIGDVVYLVIVNNFPVALFDKKEHKLNQELDNKLLKEKDCKEYISFYKENNPS